MKAARADAQHPDLCLGEPLSQPVAGGDFARVQFVFARFDVERDELAVILDSEMGADFGVVEGVASAREFLLAIATFNCGHSSSRSFATTQWQAGSLPHEDLLTRVHCTTERPSNGGLLVALQRVVDG